MISVDTVYQKVLAILNKENRGYMTPQEYNLLANQAQLEIFEQYFFDLNQYLRRGRVNHEYGDVINNIEQKLNIFRLTGAMTKSNGRYTLPSNLYKIGTITIDNNIIEETQENVLPRLLKGRLTEVTATNPVYVKSGDFVSVYPTSIVNNISISYIKKPETVNWTYTEVGGTALYNSSALGHQNFELDSSEESKIVVLILSYAGITVKAEDVYPVAEKKYVDKITLEKS